MSQDKETTETFLGFDDPSSNYSKLPNQVIESLHLIRSLAELKVLIYIIRHTWGFHETEKKITNDEFCNGRKRKDGTRIDNGCGLSSPSVIAGLKLAQKHGFINIETDNSDKARVKKYYSLRGKDFLPLGSKVFTPGVKELYPDHRKKQEKDTKEKKDSPAQSEQAPEQDLDNYFSEKKPQPQKQEKKPRKKSKSIQELEELEQTFARVRDCDLPDWSSDKKARASQANWRGPLRELLKTCRGNFRLAKQIIEIDVVEYMRGNKDPRYPMIEPRSFKTRFLARALEMRDKQASGQVELKDWEKIIVTNKGKIPDFIRGSVTNESRIGTWILNNPDATRVPESIYLGE